MLPNERRAMMVFEQLSRAARIAAVSVDLPRPFRAWNMVRCESGGDVPASIAFNTPTLRMTIFMNMNEQLTPNRSRVKAVRAFSPAFIWWYGIGKCAARLRSPRNTSV